MKKIPTLIVPILMFVLSTSGQTKFPSPPDPMNPDNANRTTEQVTLQKHVDLAQLLILFDEWLGLVEIALEKLRK